MSKPIVAIVGRPNVGKSTLFNALAGEKLSIVEDTPGVTRDRLYADATWLDRCFTIIDTGGIEPDSGDIILSQMREQAQVALMSADVVLFMVDVRQGLVDADAKVADMLRKSRKPVMLVVNKVDNFDTMMADIYEFYQLGIGDPHPIAASSKRGLGDMLDALVELLPEKSADEEEDDRVKVAIIGKPNVGKSSLVNRLVGDDRVIVSDIAGTTRDAIDTVVRHDGQEYVFIDTAGIRRKSKVKETLERYSVFRALSACDRADVVIVMIDATEGVTEQDAKIAGIAHDNGKGLLIAVNKWDAIEKDDKTMYKFRDEVMRVLSFVPYAKIVYISAKTGKRVDNLFDEIDAITAERNKRIATGVLNEIVMEAVAMNEPPTDKGRRLKVLYASQVSVGPPTFVLFVNDKKLLHFSYRRYLENQIRSAFGFEGTPIRFVIRERGEK